MEEDARNCPRAILLVSVGGGSAEELYFMHPYTPPQVEPRPVPAIPSIVVPPVEKRAPTPRTKPTPFTAHNKESAHSLNTEYGISTSTLANILCVKCLDEPLEMKIDNVRFAGYAKKVTRARDASPSMFGINFVLPTNAEAHLVESLQMLCAKLAVSIDAMNTIDTNASPANGYLGRHLREMRSILEDVERGSESDQNPYEKMRERSSLADLLAHVFDEIVNRGVVQVFLDDFIEVGFCVESRALSKNHLTPRSQRDIDRMIKYVRNYHAILLLENVMWATPDANPSVALFLKHCSPDKNIQTLSIESGIPLLQVFCIARHLLLWARAIVIYPLANTNVYTSATSPRPLGRQMEKFSRLFEDCHLAGALAQFNPPATLESFIPSSLSLAEQQLRAHVVTTLIRQQLVMQLHQYCYILTPYSDAPLPPDRDCPDALRKKITQSKMDDCVKGIVCNLCAEQLENESYSQVESRLMLFLQLAPLMNGEHHLEDMMWNLNEDRDVILEAINTFHLVISTFYRPDFIAEAP